MIRSSTALFYTCALIGLSVSSLVLLGYLPRYANIVTGFCLLYMITDLGISIKSTYMHWTKSSKEGKIEL